MPRLSKEARARALSILQRRTADVVQYYKPTPTQVLMHKSKAQYRLITGSNRCLAGEQIVAGLRIDEWHEADHWFEVQAWDEHEQKIVPAQAHDVRVKGIEECYRFWFYDGRTLACSRDHEILCTDGHYHAAWQIASGVVLHRPIDCNTGGRREIIRIEFIGKQTVYDLSVPIYENYISGGCVNHNCGKSASMAMEIHWALTGTHPYRGNFAGGNYLLITTRRQQADLVWRKKLIENSELVGVPRGTKGIIPAHKIDRIGYSTGDGINALKTINMTQESGGARLHVIWSGDPNAWKGIEGIQFDGIFIDENCVNEKLLQELAVRVRDAYDDPEKPDAGFILWAATETKVEPAFTIFRELCMNPDEKEAEYFEIQPDEVIAVTSKSAEQAGKLMSEEMREARLRGKGGAMDVVRVYPQFDKSIHTTPEQFIHSRTDNIVAAYDPGMAHNTGMLLASIRKSEPDTLHFWAGFLRTRQTIEQECAWLEEMLAGKQIYRFIYDPSARAAQKAAGGKTIAEVLRAELAKRKLLTKDAIYRFAQNDHLQGVKRVRQMLDDVKFIIHSTGEGMDAFIRQMIMYRGRPETNFKGVNGVVKKDDEYNDCSRYLCAERIVWSAHGMQTGIMQPMTEERAIVNERIDYHVERIAMAQSRRSAFRR